MFVAMVEEAEKETVKLTGESGVCRRLTSQPWLCASATMKSLPRCEL